MTSSSSTIVRTTYSQQETARTDADAAAAAVPILTKPKRPLSVYNLFFQSERKKLLQSLPAAATQGKCRRRSARGGPPKIGFANLAKYISQKWNAGQVDPDELRLFEALAHQEQLRYQDELARYKDQQKILDSTSTSTSNARKQPPAASVSSSPAPNFHQNQDAVDAEEPEGVVETQYNDRASSSAFLLPNDSPIPLVQERSSHHADAENEEEDPLYPFPLTAMCHSSIHHSVVDSDSGNFAPCRRGIRSNPLYQNLAHRLGEDGVALLTDLFLVNNSSSTTTNNGANK